MATEQFPRRALLLHVLWIPAAVALLFAYASLGWVGGHYWHPLASLSLALMLFFASYLEIRSVRSAIRVFRAQPHLRTWSNKSILALGIVIGVITLLLSFMLVMVALGT